MTRLTYSSSIIVGLLLFTSIVPLPSQSEINFDGITFPSFDTNQRNALTAVIGQCIYNTEESIIECYDGTQWLAAADGAIGPIGPKGDQGEQGPAGTQPWLISDSGDPYINSGQRIGLGVSAPAATVQIDAPVDVDPLRARVDGATKFRIHGSNGSVSIGTPTTGPENGLFVSGNAGIGTSSPNARLTSLSGLWQFELKNPAAGGSDWYMGSSADSWAAGGGRFIISPTDNSNSAALVIDEAKNVGISKLSPSTKLHVANGTDVSKASGGYITVGEDNSTNVAIDNNEIMARSDGSVAPLTLNAEGGEVRINNNGVRDADAFEVKGRVYFDNGGESGMRITATDSNPTNALFEPTQFEEGLVGGPVRPFWRVYSREFFAQSLVEYKSYSDRRLKSNILPLQDAISIIQQLEGVTYKLKPSTNKGKRALSRHEKFVSDNQIGFIAQDIEKVLPQLVSDDEFTGLKTVGYMGVIPVLVEAVKEQQSEIDVLYNKVNQLSSELLISNEKYIEIEKKIMLMEKAISIDQKMEK